MDVDSTADGRPNERVWGSFQMQFRQGVITVSATDLVNHHDCHHLTARDLAVVLGETGATTVI